jgi:ATP-dependent DNA helicase DinG
VSKLKLRDMQLPDIFKSGGLLSKVVPGYIPRLPQIQATETIQDAFDKRLHALIEAGTGTGKSYIVLFAAVYWAIKNGKKVVISLPSQVLQEQLFKLDVPRVLEALDFVEEDVKIALAIGRGNYVCLRKVDKLYNQIKQQIKSTGKQTLLSNEELLQFKEITLSLNKENILGYKGDLEFVPDDKLWSKIYSSTDSCIGKKCAFYEDCHYFKSKKKVEEADVIISNNALLFADMSQKIEMGFDNNASLPPYNFLMFDEAHNLENSATSFFKQEINQTDILDVVLSITKNQNLSNYIDDKVKFNKMVTNIAKILNSTGKYIFPFIDRKDTQYRARNKKTQDDPPMEEIILTRMELEALSKYFKGIKVIFKEYLDVMNIIEKKIKDIQEPTELQMLEFKRLTSIKHTIGSIIKKCDDIFNDFNAENLYFLKKTILDKYKDLSKYSVWTISKTPINLGNTFQKYMFNTCDHVIMLSATISTDGNFDFFRSRLGFKPTDQIKELVVDSPFDYAKQGIVYLFKNAPDSKSTEFENFINEQTFKILQKTSGGTFKLFTSTALMDRSYAKLAYRIENELGIKCLKQGQESKSMIIQRFREYQQPGSGYKSAILFAGNSFWEGVSVEGTDLMNVIITKLPFPVPTDPIISARCRYLDSIGINSFNKYIIPLATIPLKQGIGRLIRDKGDRGNIFIYDSRLCNASYKDKILNSLPGFLFKNIVE